MKVALGWTTAGLNGARTSALVPNRVACSCLAVATTRPLARAGCTPAWAGAWGRLLTVMGTGSCGWPGTRALLLHPGVGAA